MELKDFIKETVKSYVEGIYELRDELGDVATVEPSNILSANEDDSELVSHNGKLAKLRKIDFDIAVTTSETGSDEAGAGIFIASFGLGGKTKSDTENSNYSRIQFSINLFTEKLNDSEGTSRHI